MAIARTGPLIVDIRGKVGSDVFHRTQGGLTVRDVGTWVQPDTQLQLDARAVITALSQAWSGTLNEAQRDTWRQYGAHHLLPNRWGVPTTRSGINTFLRTNAYQYRSTQAIEFATAPTLPPLHPPAVTIAVEANAALDVAGTPVPDCTGKYHLTTPWATWPCWKHDTEDYWLWYPRTVNWWCISTEVGVGTDNRWAQKYDLLGTYTPWGTAQGNVEVTKDPAHSAIEIALPPINYLSPFNDLRLFAFGGAPQTPGTARFHGPWRYIGDNTYDAGWTLDPWRVVYPFDIDAAQHCWAYLVAQDAADGRLSTPFRADAFEAELDT